MSNNVKNKSLSDVGSTEELISFLDSGFKNKCHDYYHHFTNFSKLEKVLETGNWRFTPDSTKNDLHEYNVKESFEKRNKILSVSLSRCDEDNMAMWAMYSIPWEDAVRITLTKEAVLKWRKIVMNYAKKNDKVDYVKLHDIIYYQGFTDDGDNNNNSLIIDGQTKEGIKEELFSEIQHPDRLSSYIKNSAWKQEQESRLSIFFKEDCKKTVDIPFGKAFPFILNNMIITFGPWTSENMIKKKMDRVIDILCKKRIKFAYHYVHKLNLKMYTNDNRNNTFNTLSELRGSNDSPDAILPGRGLIFSTSPLSEYLKLRRHCDVCPWEHATRTVHNLDGNDSFWIK